MFTPNCNNLEKYHQISLSGPWSATYSWFATTRQGGHVGGQNKRIFPRRMYMKIEFSSQRREMLLFLTTNMAAVTSRANQQSNFKIMTFSRGPRTAYYSSDFTHNKQKSQNRETMAKKLHFTAVITQLWLF